jgi:ketosteroid isomerase-like protein
MIAAVMTENEEHNLNRVRDYLAALERGDSGESLRVFFADDMQQIELPNRLNPKGQQSDLAGMLARSQQGKKVLRSQRYETVSAIAQGERIATEAIWTGVLAIPLGTLAEGAEMKAHFAMFFEFREGKIRLQRNYDCFEAW